MVSESKKKKTKNCALETRLSKQHRHLVVFKNRIMALVSAALILRLKQSEDLQREEHGTSVKMTGISYFLTWWSCFLQFSH